MAFSLVRYRGGSPPANAIQLACQNDGGGQQWSAVSHTEQGDIPGKAQGGTCWYPYGGKEQTTSEFSYIIPGDSDVALSRNKGSPPEGALAVGYQKDGAGTEYAAVANSQWGTIPGKAKGNTCWFAYGGKEHATNDFSWVLRKFILVRYRGGSPPANAIQLACQNDGGGQQWSAVAHTEQGDIPGKAKGGTCWYPYGGKEQTTSEFSYIIPGDSDVALSRNKGSPPEGALAVGYQKDGAGTEYAAVANSQWGTIPGKAKGNTCWFAYGGKEHATNDFSWIVLGSF